MSEYLEIIRTSFIFFPVIVFIFTIPYILFQYHKYGSIYYFRVIIIYSFILYLLTAYFLVILPLPTIEEVVKLTTPRMQLVPFQFVSDFIRETSFRITDIHTYLKALLEPCSYVVFYNLLLCLPFGVYLHYYFQKSFGKTLFYTFLLSLFFELTQLSGLYFIYPRGYRLFDVDDLILNTLGGVIGYFVATIFMRVLPSRRKIDDKAYLLGQKISFLKRGIVVSLDAFFSLLVFFFIYLSHISFNYIYVYIFLYYFIIPIVLKGKTVSLWFLNMKIESKTGVLKWYQIWIRNFLWLFEWLGVFYLLLIVMINISSYSVIILLILFLYYLVLWVKFITKKAFIYDRCSHTRLVSTIQIHEED